MSESRLSDDLILKIVRETVQGNTLRLTRDVGPYEVTEPTYELRKLLHAVELALAAQEAQPAEPKPNFLQKWATVINESWPTQPAEQAAQPVAPVQHFGIIDPDYARIFTQARIIAWQYGYACLAHGSFTRDLDLLLVPWTDAAQAKDVDYFAPRIADAAGLKVSGHPPSIRPHGRKTWTLLLPGFADPRWVDLSIYAAPLSQEVAGEVERAVAEERERCAKVCESVSSDLESADENAEALSMGAQCCADQIRAGA